MVVLSFTSFYKPASKLQLILNVCLFKAGVLILVQKSAPRKLTDLLFSSLAFQRSNNAFTTNCLRRPA